MSLINMTVYTLHLKKKKPLVDWNFLQKEILQNILNVNKVGLNLTYESRVV